MANSTPEVDFPGYSLNILIPCNFCSVSFSIFLFPLISQTLKSTSNKVGINSTLPGSITSSFKSNSKKRKIFELCPSEYHGGCATWIQCGRSLCLGCWGRWQELIPGWIYWQTQKISFSKTWICHDGEIYQTDFLQHVLQLDQGGLTLSSREQYLNKVMLNK